MRSSSLLASLRAARHCALAALVAGALAGTLGGALVGCATPEAKAVCYPVTGWATPVFRCGAAAAPVAVAPPPEPVKEAEPEVVVEEPPPAPKAEVKDDKIELTETVEFETESAVLLERSKALLDDVAQVLNDHPEIKRVQIEGHTDAVASRRHNQKLSQQRVASVKSYLVEKGIDGKRLVTKSFGETKPLASNKTDEGRAKNRRVEFRILRK
jgi:OmpA-OmpF porin, OOP family